MANPKHDPQSPWNPAYPANVTPEEYEKQVTAWLRAYGDHLECFEVQHRRHLHGTGGDYEFDAVAEFSLFQGARFVVLVECKRYSRPVEREKVVALWGKLQDVAGHKAIVFATCGFQSGALQFAAEHGIATVVFVDGSFLYETKAIGIASEPPPWANLPLYAGILVSRTDDGTVHTGVIDWEHPDGLSNWLRS